MFLSTRWFARELERRDRSHAQQLDAERAAWRDERRELIDTICVLAGRPNVDDTPDPEPDPDVYAADILQQPFESEGFGDELLTVHDEG